ncbi:MAG: hypothetical protein OZ914_01910 [Anaerolineaceae bacterium]|nr:hypothetical protein [Anaerolineaceae bacterium]OQY87570.1 MAG: hypothetical protein B6D38_12315 [Anaerolineae bacterium UTCFX1]
MNNKRKFSSLFLSLYFMGLAAGFVLIFFATWADLESAYYGFDYTGSEPFSTLQCPIFMTKAETESFSVEVTNKAERRIINASLITNISTPVLMETANTLFSLEPGETKKLEWEIGPQHIDLGRFIFIRAWLHRAYPNPDKEGSCGVYVLSLPGKGVYYAWGLALCSLLGMGGSLFGLKDSFSAAPNGAFVRLMALALIVLAGLIATYLSFWMGGVLALVLAVLMSAISFGAQVNADLSR